MKERIIHLTSGMVKKELWDSWIFASVNKRICATSWFLDCFSPGWEALVMDGGRAVMPVTRGRKFGVNYVFQPIFVQQLGLFYADDSYARYLPLFIEKLSSLYRFIDVSLNEHNDFVGSLHGVRDMNNYILRLDMPYNSVAAAFSNNTRRNITKADKSAITLQHGFSPSETIRMFRMNNAIKYRGIKNRNYARLQSALESGVAKGLISIVGARAGDGKVLASACFLKDFDRYVFFFSANTDEGRRQGAMYKLINSFLQEHSGSDMLFDFNGSMDPGIARFYTGFGAMLATYRRVRVNNLIFPANYLK
jgi:hypothetical protein